MRVDKIKGRTKELYRVYNESDEHIATLSYLFEGNKYLAFDWHRLDQWKLKVSDVIPLIEELEKNNA